MKKYNTSFDMAKTFAGIVINKYLDGEDIDERILSMAIFSIVSNQFSYPDNFESYKMLRILKKHRAGKELTPDEDNRLTVMLHYQMLVNIWGKK